MNLNDGRGRFTLATGALPSVREATKSVVAFDADLDGDIDLLFGNGIHMLSAPDRLYLNDGRATFADATARIDQPPWGFETQSVAAGDLDGDGDVDVVSGASGDFPMRLFRNGYRHTSADAPPRIGTPHRIDFRARPGFAKGPQAVVAFLSQTESVPPIPVPPFGRWGLGTGPFVDVPPLLVPWPAGRVALQFGIPNDGFLVGQALNCQALVLHGVTPAQWKLTNTYFDRIVR